MDAEQKLLVAKKVFEQEINTLIITKERLNDVFVKIEEALVNC